MGDESDNLGDEKTNGEEADEDNVIENAEYIKELVKVEGELESPIDLNISKMRTIKLTSLSWFNHDVLPKKIKLTNTGRTVILSAKWLQERPFLIDGPLMGNYVFSQIHFHWGVNDMEGSEHCADGGRMPMELHAVHFKSDYGSQNEALRKKDGIIVLVYFFKLQNSANPSMDNIVKYLPAIVNPKTSTRITPQSLMTILRPFTDDYFLYWGSITTSLRAHCILWVVSREPIGASTEQIAAFRTLKNMRFNPILNNCRTLQHIRNRSIFHVNPSGSLYATLLSIPYGPPPAIANPLRSSSINI